MRSVEVMLPLAVFECLMVRIEYELSNYEVVTPMSKHLIIA